MADIADAAAISRATLYTHFRDKEALLRALAEYLVSESLQRMRDAWQPDAAFGDNLEAAIVAKDLPLHRLKHTSPHGGELLDSSSETVVASSKLLEQGVIAFFNDRAAEAARTGRRFSLFGGVEHFGSFVAHSVAGYKNTVASEDRYRASIRTFANLIETGTVMEGPKRRSVR